MTKSKRKSKRIDERRVSTATELLSKIMELQKMMDEPDMDLVREVIKESGGDQEDKATARRYWAGMKREMQRRQTELIRQLPQYFYK